MSLTRSGITGFDPSNPGPIGAQNPSTGKFTAITDTGNFTMTGASARWIADFSSAADVRTTFKTSTTNGNTQINAIPDGSGNTSGWIAFNTSDPLNASYFTLRCTSSAANLISGANGTGAVLPISLITNATGLTQTLSGLVQIGKGLAITASATVNNGATTTYTYPADTSYVYLTTSAASLAFTLPAAASTIDGLLIILCPSASVATVTWASTGATFVGAPTSLVANTPVRMKYTHADLKWYPA